MGNEVLFLIIAGLTGIYWFTFYRFMKETGQMKDERGRRINQIASEKVLIIVQMMLLAGLLMLEKFETLDASKLLALIYAVAILGHASLRYYYTRVM
jgi:uncharacterized membrane protein